jgi:hypothetical protein
VSERDGAAHGDTDERSLGQVEFVEERLEDAAEVVGRVADVRFLALAVAGEVGRVDPVPSASIGSAYRQETSAASRPTPWRRTTGGPSPATR